MDFAGKFNKDHRFVEEAYRFNVDTTVFGITSTADFFEKNGKDSSKVYPLKGIRINRTQYGEKPVFATNGALVRVPPRMLDIANRVLKDDDAIREINDGKVGFKITPYFNKKLDKELFDITFVNLDDNTVPGAEKIEQTGTETMVRDLF